MPRDADSLKIEKWAATGNVVDPATEGIDRAEGWGIDYSTPGGKVPTREGHNEIWREITALAVEVNRHGCGLEWNAAVNYLHPALVTSTDGNFYVSQQGSNLNHDPVNDDGTWWTRLVPTTISVSQAQKLANIEDDATADQTGPEIMGLISTEVTDEAAYDALTNPSTDHIYWWED